MSQRVVATLLMLLAACSPAQAPRPIAVPRKPAAASRPAADAILEIDATDSVSGDQVEVAGWRQEPGGVYWQTKEHVGIFDPSHGRTRVVVSDPDGEEFQCIGLPDKPGAFVTVNRKGTMAVWDAEGHLLDRVSGAIVSRMPNDGFCDLGEHGQLVVHSSLPRFVVVSIEKVLYVLDREHPPSYRIPRDEEIQMSPKGDAILVPTLLSEHAAHVEHAEVDLGGNEPAIERKYLYALFDLASRQRRVSLSAQAATWDTTGARFMLFEGEVEDEGSTAHLYDARTHVRLWTRKHLNQRTFRVDRFSPDGFSPDGRTLLTSVMSKHVHYAIIDARTGRELATWPTNSDSSEGRMQWGPTAQWFTPTKRKSRATRAADRCVS